jgi:hypothetical protein
VVMMSGDDVLTEPMARRIEVFTGAGRRRKWSPEAKAVRIRPVARHDEFSAAIPYLRSACGVR